MGYSHSISSKEIAEAKDKWFWDNREQWIHLVKGWCVECMTQLKNPVENYHERGNFCMKCNSKYGRDQARDPKATD